MKKLIVLFLLIAIFSIVAKEIIAKRTHGFIMQCLSSEEVELILDESVTAATKEKQLQVTKRALVCVKGKQSVVENVIFNALGGKLFYRIYKE